MKLEESTFPRHRQIGAYMFESPLESNSVDVFTLTVLAAMLQDKLKSRLSRVQSYGTVASQYCTRAVPTVLSRLRTTVLVNAVLSRNNSQKST